MRFTLAILFAPLCLLAQLPAPNSLGVAMGHLHLNTTDTAASRRFWVEYMGGSVVQFAGIDVYKFRDALVMVRKGTVLGPSEGSAINHLGFEVKNLATYLENCTKFGFKVQRLLPETHQAFILGPDDVKVELTENTALDIPVAHHHIHFFNTTPIEARDWYVKMFDAKPRRRGKFETADVPGVNLSFAPSPAPTLPSKGRAADHFGFEVRNLEQFVKTLQAQGIKFDIPYRKVEKLGIAVAFFTDPWGAYVELTEGLDKI